MNIKFDKILGDVRERDDSTFTFTQGVAATTWSVAHNLNKRPSVSTVDSMETQVEGKVVYVDDNNLTIEFNAAMSGKAYLN